MPTFRGVRLRDGKRYVMTQAPLTDIRSMRYGQRLRPKPAGLWYSCGPAWLEWVEREVPHWIDDYTCLYEIDVDLSRMVVLRTARGFDAFTRRFGADGNDVIDWRAVEATGAAGVEICPYQYRRRREPHWYYTWDVASGCVWDPAAVVRLRQLVGP
jgi:hypothetical protein